MWLDVVLLTAIISENAPHKFIQGNTSLSLKYFGNFILDFRVVKTATRVVHIAA